MRKTLFGISILFSTLVVIFSFTKVSLNGYKVDFYFAVATVSINLFCFWILYRGDKTKLLSYVNLLMAIAQGIGIGVFLWVWPLQVDKVYRPIDNKVNLYSVISGWYHRSYFSPHMSELCADGELWQTKVPTYFPLIEIETQRDECHKLGTDSTYKWQYQHVPE